MTTRDRRAMLLGLFTVAAAVFGLQVVPWALALGRSGWEEYRAKTGLLARVEADLREAPALEDSARVTRAALAELPGKLLAGPEAAAAGELAGRLSREATQHRVRLDRTDVRPDSAAIGWLRRVTLGARLEGDSRGVLSLLGGLAQGTPVVSVTSAHIVAGELSPTGPEVLAVELTLGGWYLDSAGAAR